MNETLWKQYQQHIDTYKFYLSITVKIMGLYFAVTGAMLSFYFTNSTIESAKLALYLPWIMSVGLFLLFAAGVYLNSITRKDVFNIRDKLNLQVSPELGVLTLLLIIFSIVLFVCIIGISYVIWC